MPQAKKEGLPQGLVSKMDELRSSLPFNVTKVEVVVFEPNRSFLFHGKFRKQGYAVFTD
jgi:hypothetical protein